MQSNRDQETGPYYVVVTVELVLRLSSTCETESCQLLDTSCISYTISSG